MRQPLGQPVFTAWSRSRASFLRSSGHRRLPEIRAGLSTVLFMPHYREPMALRILETAWRILRPYPEYRGRERWTDHPGSGPRLGHVSGVRLSDRFLLAGG